MSDAPTFGRYAEIPVDRMTLEQREGYRFLVEGPRGRLPGPYKVWVHNPKLVHAAAPLGQHFRHTSGHMCVVGGRVLDAIGIEGARMPEGGVVERNAAARPTNTSHGGKVDMYQTDQYEGMIAETVTMRGHNGDLINAYLARPLGAGPFPGMALIHHAPGWDEWYRECTRRFAHHGYVSISPNLYFRDGHGSPEDVGAKVRAAGGAPDARVLGDLDGANTHLRSLPYVSRKIGVFGTCSGGRHGFLAACRLKGFDTLIDCWGGRVVQSKEELTPNQPVAPIDYTKDLSCPMLGLFGNDDKSPTPEQVNAHEAELKKHGKRYEFHRYDGAGHGFFYYDRPAYRQEQAVDGWKKVLAFCERTLR